MFVAAIAQLGERQTEDLKVPGSIPGLGIIVSIFQGSAQSVSGLIVAKDAKEKSEGSRGWHFIQKWIAKEWQLDRTVSWSCQFPSKSRWRFAKCNSCADSLMCFVNSMTAQRCQMHNWCPQCKPEDAQQQTPKIVKVHNNRAWNKFGFSQKQ